MFVDCILSSSSYSYSSRIHPASISTILYSATLPPLFPFHSPLFLLLHKEQLPIKSCRAIPHQTPSGRILESEYQRWNRWEPRFVTARLSPLPPSRTGYPVHPTSEANIRRFITPRLSFRSRDFLPVRMRSGHGLLLPSCECRGAAATSGCEFCWRI